MKRYSIVLLLGLIFLLGCNNGRVKLGGKVTYEDGSAVPHGTVVFATESYQAKGQIESDGTFEVSSTGVKDGLPPGKYKVYIIGATEDVAGKRGESSRSLIDKKYDNYVSTPLSCEVPAPKNTFDIKVPKNPDSK